MAASKKKTAPVEEETTVSVDATTDTIEEATTVEAVSEEVIPVTEEEITGIPEEVPVVEEAQKYNIGSIVFVSKDTTADLNGFKLFPQYKKCTYTVESYDADTQVYTLRRLNLALRLKEENIVAPSERAHDQLNRRQF